MFIAIYIDNLLIINKVNVKLDMLQNQLKARFKMTNLEKVTHYFSMQVNINLEKSEIMLCKKTYLKKILEKFHLQDCKLISSPMKPRTGNLLLPFKDQADQRTIKWY